MTRVRIYVCRNCGRDVDWDDPRFQRKLMCVKCNLKYFLDNNPDKKNIVMISDYELIMYKRGDSFYRKARYGENRTEKFPLEVV